MKKDIKESGVCLISYNILSDSLTEIKRETIKVIIAQMRFDEDKGRLQGGRKQLRAVTVRWTSSREMKHTEYG